MNGSVGGRRGWNGLLRRLKHPYYGEVGRPLQDRFDDRAQQEDSKMEGFGEEEAAAMFRMTLMLRPEERITAANGCRDEIFLHWKGCK